MAQMKHLYDFYVRELLDDWDVGVPTWEYPRNLESPRVSSPGFGKDSKVMVIRMPLIGGYHPYGLASILTGLEFNRPCVRYAWPTNCSPSTLSHLSTGTSEGIA
ncbi:nibrin [Trichonephila clavipes]|nr:nibrin [Trichonephila clavipes]